MNSEPNRRWRRRGNSGKSGPNPRRIPWASTLIARFLGWTEIPERRRYWAGVIFEQRGIHLTSAGKLRAHEPSRPRTDVTLRASYARMRTVQVRGKFRLHHRVAGFPAELNRLGVFVSLVAPEGGNQQKAHTADNKESEVLTVSGIGEVN